MNIDLKNKNAMVCGSTQGIGKACATQLALMGANVTLVARNEQALQQTVKTLDVSKGQSHSFLCADFSNSGELRQKVEQFISNKKPFHILINNTGGPTGGPIVNAQTTEFTDTFSKHLLCNHLLMQLLVGGMKEQQYGRIINIISTSVKQPIPGLGVSNTIRAAVANWAKTLSLELAPYGITVNNVLPGATATSRIDTLVETKAKKTGKSVDEIKTEMLHEIPMKRFAQADEIANAACFLASPAAAYITGINMPVDGGRTACL